MSQTTPNPLEPAVPAESAAPAEPAGRAEATLAPPAILVSAGPVKGRGISNRALNVLLGGAVILAVAGVAFAIGRMTAPAPTITAGAFPGGGTFNGPTTGGNGANGPIRGNGQGGFVLGGGGPSIEGTVESVSDTTLTIRTADGQTIQIALNDATTYHAQTDASASDVVTGGKVLVRLDFRRIDGGNGPAASGAPGPAGGGMTANDVTVVP